VTGLPHDLGALAVDVGIDTEYWDVKGRHRPASVDALLAALRAAGAPIDDVGEAASCRARLARRRCEQGLEPVMVAWDGASTDAPLWIRADHGDDGGDVEVALGLESGDERAWRLSLRDLPVCDHVEVDGSTFVRRLLTLPEGLPTGRHRLWVSLGSGHEVASTVLAAPRRAAGLPSWARTWGVLAPTYALRRQSGGGADLGALDELGAWVGRHGAQVVATLPLLSAFLDEPFDPSPYAPVSRRFYNELYLDLGALPGAAARAAAGTELARASVRELADDPTSSRFDYRRRAALVRRVLDAAAAAFFRADEQATFDAFVAATPDIADYAEFRAAVDYFGDGWHGWPEGARAGDLDGVPLDAERVRYHLYAQWAVGTQLDQLAANLRRRDQRLYLDLPVGSHPSGYDTWRNRALFAEGVTTGAPPDEFFEAGQTWGFPPLQPMASRRDGHRFFAECLRAHLRCAGMLRIDHVMQYHRLFWVPDGMSPQEGVYVRYPREELFATLVVEASRSDCILVGEDLGTVPDEIRHAMHAHGLLGMYVLQFEAPADGRQLRAPPHDTVSSLNTHDTPTFAAFARSLDIDRRVDEGYVDRVEAEGLRDERQRQLAALHDHLVGEGLLVPDASENELVRAALGWLATSESACLLVALDDLWAQTEAHNVPGTPVDRPNWVLRWPRSIEELSVDLALGVDLDAIQGARLGSYARAVEDR
jgi:4-alpha-glucanotransferase